MGENDNDPWHLGWRTPMVFAALATAVLIAYRIWPGFAAICPANESLSGCSREWIAATSGYVAAIFAAITIIFLYHQNAEQKKQTEFLLGDARPTIDAIQHMRRPHTVVIRIVNWNRRPILIQTIAVPGSQCEICISNIEIADRDNPKTTLVDRELLTNELYPPLAMHGWKDRSQAPCEVRIDIFAKDPATEQFAEDWRESSVTVGFVMAGETRRRFVVRSPVAVVD